MTLRLPWFVAVLLGAAIFTITIVVPDMWGQFVEPLPKEVAPFGGEVLLLAIALTLMAIDRRPWRTFGFCLPKASIMDWIVATALGGACGAIAVVLINLTPAEGMQSMMKSLIWWQIPLLIWFAAPLTEELFVRGLVMGWMERDHARALSLGAARVPVSALAGAALFGAMHLTLIHHGSDGWTVAIIVTMTAMLGVVTGYYRVKTKSLAVPLVAHLAYNVGGPLTGVVMAILMRLPH